MNRQLLTCGSVPPVPESPGKKRPTRRTSGPAAAAAATKASGRAAAGAPRPHVRHTAKAASNASLRRWSAMSRGSADGTRCWCLRPPQAALGSRRRTA